MSQRSQVAPYGLWVKREVGVPIYITSFVTLQNPKPKKNAISFDFGFLLRQHRPRPSPHPLDLHDEKAHAHGVVSLS